MSLEFGAKRFTNSSSDTNRWNFDESGSCTAAASASRSSGFWTLRITDAFTTSAAGVGPRSCAWLGFWPWLERALTCVPRTMRATVRDVSSNESSRARYDMRTPWNTDDAFSGFRVNGVSCLSRRPVKAQACRADEGWTRISGTHEKDLPRDGPPRRHVRHHLRHRVLVLPQRHVAGAAPPVGCGRLVRARRSVQRRRSNGGRRARVPLLHRLHNHGDLLRGCLAHAVAHQPSRAHRAAVRHRRLRGHELGRDSALTH